MVPDIYYHILEIGFRFEKGRKDGDSWRFGEKKLLSDECRLWRNLIRYAESESEGIDCTDQAFRDLTEICRKHRLENYERVIGLRAELEASRNRFEIGKEEENELTERMLQLISGIEESTKTRNGKADAYEALQKLHNIPRAMHGTDALGTAVPITFAEVKKYTDGE